jgi:hypothetical protein
MMGKDTHGKLPQFECSGRKRLIVPATNSDGSAQRSEPESYGAADAAASSGDKSNFLRERLDGLERSVKQSLFGHEISSSARPLFLREIHLSIRSIAPGFVDSERIIGKSRQMKNRIHVKLNTASRITACGQPAPFPIIPPFS